MNLTSLINDNITEILTLLIEFTQARQKVLIRNITNSHVPGYVPQELDVNEFSNLLNFAIDEHIRTNRLVLYDSKNIKFGSDGDFYFTSIEDENCKILIDDNVDEYYELQIKKLWENSLNQKVAAEMLKQKQKPFTVNYK
jgi:flagellar basal body rod protein FlgB